MTGREVTNVGGTFCQERLGCGGGGAVQISSNGGRRKWARGSRGEGVPPGDHTKRLKAGGRPLCSVWRHVVKEYCARVVHRRDVALDIPPRGSVADDVQHGFPNVQLKSADVDKVSNIGQVGSGLSYHRTAVRVGDDHRRAVNLIDALTNHVSVFQQTKTWAASFGHARQVDGLRLPTPAGEGLTHPIPTPRAKPTTVDQQQYRSRSVCLQRHKHEAVTFRRGHSRPMLSPSVQYSSFDLLMYPSTKLLATAFRK